MGVATFPAKYAAPTATSGRLKSFAARRVRDEPLVVFASPPGYLDLAVVAEAVGDQAVWIWLDEFDDAPSSLISSIAHGVCRRLGTSVPPSLVGTAVSAVDYRWSKAVESFGHELESVLAGRPVVVASPSRDVGEGALTMLCEGLFPAMGATARVVVVTCDNRKVDHTWGAPVIGPGELRVRPDEIEAFAADVDAALPARLVRRAARLTEGRGATLSSVLLAGSMLGADVFSRAVKDADDLGEMLAALTHLSLSGLPPDVFASLEVVSRLGVTHPRLVEAAIGHASTIGAPWLLELEDDWALADPLWRRALTMILGSVLPSHALGRIAGELLVEGAPELALPLCREAGDVRGIARCFEQIARRPDGEHRWKVLQGEMFGVEDPSSSRDRRRPRRESRQRTAAPRRWGRLGCYLRPSDIDDESSPVHADGAESRPDLAHTPPEPTTPVHDASKPPTTTFERGGRSGCEARLLGSFELSVAGSAVGDWAGSRGRSVLKYLLVNRDRPVRKETLMELFWPGADPDASRNCLNVAVSSLRRSLRPRLNDVPVVLYHEGSYRINPAIDVWVDVDHFETSSIDGLGHYGRGDLAAATVALTEAASVYRGAFLEDDPFEEWASPTRERLRVRFLDVLDRLSEIAFVQDRYEACIEVCQRILSEDSCREDTQRLVMRCHSRQGRWHLGLRQYHSCVESLKSELAVDPASETVALYEDMRHHRPV